jgi:hypothetical protein
MARVAVVLTEVDRSDFEKKKKKIKSKSFKKVVDLRLMVGGG